MLASCLIEYSSIRAVNGVLEPYSSPASSLATALLQLLVAVEVYDEVRPRTVTVRQNYAVRSYISLFIFYFEETIQGLRAWVHYEEGKYTTSRPVGNLQKSSFMILALLKRSFLAHAHFAPVAPAL